MTLQNSNNQSFSVKVDGWSLGAGQTTRTLTLAGADLSLLLTAPVTNDILRFNGTNWVNVAGTTYGTGSVTSVATGTGLTGGPVTNTGTISIAAHGVTGALFRQSAATTLVGNAGTATGDVSDISIGTGLTLPTSGTLALGTSGVTAGSFGDSTHFTTFTVDALGRVTTAGTVLLGDMAFQNSNNVNITGGTITGLPNPTNASDAATKAYVDGIAAGLDAKQSVRVATAPADGNIDLTTGGLLTIDGVTVNDGDRVLVKNQTSAAENGIYIAHSGSWLRAPDMDTTNEVPAAYTFVVSGNTQSGNGYVVTGFTSADLINIDPIVFTQFSQAGAYTAGNGLSINISNTPAVFTLNLATLVAGTSAIGSSDLIAISQGGTTVSTTVGSLATAIAGASVFGADVINVSAGTVTLRYDSEFTNAGGTLGLGDITPTSINTAGSIYTTGSFQAANALVTGTIYASNIGVAGTFSGASVNTTDGTITNLSVPGTATIGTVAATDGTFTGNVNVNGTITASNISGTNTGDQVITLIGDISAGPLTTGTFSTTLSNTGVTAGTYGNNNHPAIITVDAKGRISAASTGTVALGTGSVTSIDTGAYLVGGPITNSGTISHGTSGVSAGTYSQVVVDAYGHVTAGTSKNMSWVDVTGTAITMSAGTGYMADNVTLVTLTLPALANFGDIIPLVGFGSGGWVIAQNAGQVIHFGDIDTTLGTAGYIASVDRFDSLELFCAKDNTDFVVRNSVGNMNVN